MEVMGMPIASITHRAEAFFSPDSRDLVEYVPPSPTFIRPRLPRAAQRLRRGKPQAGDGWR